MARLQFFFNFVLPLLFTDSPVLQCIDVETLPQDDLFETSDFEGDHQETDSEDLDSSGDSDGSGDSDSSDEVGKSTKLAQFWFRIYKKERNSKGNISVPI